VCCKPRVVHACACPGRWARLGAHGRSRKLCALHAPSTAGTFMPADISPCRLEIRFMTRLYSIEFNVTWSGSTRHLLSLVCAKCKGATVTHACGAGGAGLVRAILAEALGLSASALGGVQVVLTGACDAAAEQPAGALGP